MTNIQYITDAEGHKTAVILLIEDYDEVFQSTIKTKTLVAVKAAYDLLAVPKEARDFVDALIRLHGSDWDLERILINEKLAEVTGLSEKTIQRKRDDLEVWVKSENGKAIVDYRIEKNERQQNTGTVYKLNIVQSVYEAINDYINSKEIDLREFCRIAKDLDTFDLKERSGYSKPFKDLIDYTEKHLNQLPNEGKFERTPVTEGSVRFQNMKRN